ncbi:MAG: NAD(P)/FAD-dependent oxidoreductase [Actinomycetales bacterium]
MTNDGAVARVVIVGGGLAGAKTAEALRAAGYAGAVTLLAGEDELPYDRPPLSKSYLQGQSEFSEALVHPEQWYAGNDVDLRLGTRAVAADADAQSVTLSSGETLPWDRLVLATGARPRALPVPGGDAPGLLSLRTRSDADALRKQLSDGGRVVIVGGGWIGLEVAAAARTAGADVTVLEAAELPLLPVLGPELAQVFADLHREHGVDLRTGVGVSEILLDGGRPSGVGLADGTVVEAGAVVVAVGVTPDVALAEQLGLAVDNGVRVDASLRSSNPRVFAVGDIANVDHPVLRQRIRSEHWATALNQPSVAAAAIAADAGLPVGSDAATWQEPPYFYTDQYDLGMEYIGHVARGEQSRVVVRGDLGKREFVAFWLNDADQLLAVMNVNVWDVPDVVKPLVLERRVVSPERLADPEVPLDQL